SDTWKKIEGDKGSDTWKKIEGDKGSDTWKKIEGDKNYIMLSMLNKPLSEENHDRFRSEAPDEEGKKKFDAMVNDKKKRGESLTYGDVRNFFYQNGWSAIFDRIFNEIIRSEIEASQKDKAAPKGTVKLPQEEINKNEQRKESDRAEKIAEEHSPETDTKKRFEEWPPDTEFFTKRGEGGAG
ncbi:MAG: hypothetical protein N3G22_05005, partial [Candidatus Micrarchaeota archaeon]|nr:hypothetical protein [Candidatus Micrarchaeota archaeon]